MDNDDSINENKKEYVNGQGVRFTTQILVPFTSNINSFHSILENMLYYILLLNHTLLCFILLYMLYL